MVVLELEMQLLHGRSAERDRVDSVFCFNLEERRL